VAVHLLLDERDVLVHGGRDGGAGNK